MTLSDIRRLVHYIALKATAMVRQEVFGSLEAAVVQMWAVSQMNRRVKVPLYHFCLSWTALEKPTDKQIMEAADLALKALGAAGHQAVIGIHRDREGVHVHVAVLRIHPGTGKAFSTSHDYAKLEKLCRQVELRQGWAADRGRFDVAVDEGPEGLQVRLVPPSKATRDAKQRRRAAGRGASVSDLGHERRTGQAPLAERLSLSWKTGTRAALDRARNWAGLHGELAPLGLEYIRAGSGARIRLRGGDASLTPSQLGSAYSLPALQTRLGPWQNPESGSTGPWRTPDRPSRPAPPAVNPAGHHAPRLVAFATGVRDDPGARRALAPAETCKRSLLERTYTRIAQEDDLAGGIRRVALDAVPPRVVLRNGTEVCDEGDRIGTSRGNDCALQARVMVAMALAKGWTACSLTGSPGFQRSFAGAAARAGLAVRDLPSDIAAEMAGHVAAGTTGQAKAGPGPDAAGSFPRPKAWEVPSPVPLAPGPQPAHILRDLERDRRRALRDKARAEAAALEDRQASERRRLTALLGNRRGPLETILRRGLAQHQAATRKNLHARRPKLPPLPVLPLDAAARQERSGRQLRAGEFEHSAVLAPDHTSCRQHWRLGRGASASRILVNIDEEVLARHSDEVRRGPFDGLLMAHRDAAGGIVGFEQIVRLPDGTFMDGIAPGGRRTAFVLGNPVTATTVIVVANGSDAITLAAAANPAHTIYVSVAGKIDKDTQRRLDPLLTGREVLAVFRPDAAGDALMTQLAVLCPWAERVTASGPQAPPVEDTGSVPAPRSGNPLLKEQRSAGKDGPDAGAAEGSPGAPEEPSTDAGPCSERPPMSPFPDFQA